MSPPLTREFGIGPFIGVIGGHFWGVYIIMRPFIGVINSIYES